MTLTSLEYQLAATFIAGTFSVMLAAAIFFLVSRETVRGGQRQAVLVAAVYTGIAAFHYSRILNSWTDSFAYQAGKYVSTGAPVFHGYRYADWLITVPLLVAQLVMVLALDGRMSRRLIIRMGTAAALMVAIGYPGEVSENNSTKLIFWGLGVIPFVYLVYVLYVGMSESLRRQPKNVVRTISTARLLLVSSWTVYPVVYLLPLLGLAAGASEVIRQVGYSVADVIAKPLFALLLLKVAQAKSAEEAENELFAAPAAASSVPVSPVASPVGQAAFPAQSPKGSRVPMGPAMSAPTNEFNADQEDASMRNLAKASAQAGLNAAALADVEAALQAPPRPRVPTPPTF